MGKNFENISMLKCVRNQNYFYILAYCRCIILLFLPHLNHPIGLQLVCSIFHPTCFDYIFFRERLSDTVGDTLRSVSHLARMPIK
jgi:hypothetical protein